MAGKNKLLQALGVIFIIFWIGDFYNNAYLKNDYSWVLWYSSSGFLMTGIALIIQNTKLIYSLFCALFLLEIVWVLDFFYILVTKASPFGFANYILSANFTTRDFIFTLYHILIPFGVLLAAVKNKEVFKYGWLGALIFATTLSFLTYFLLNASSQVNCIHSVN